MLPAYFAWVCPWGMKQGLCGCTAAQASNLGSCRTSRVGQQIHTSDTVRCRVAGPSARHPSAAGAGGRRKPSHKTQIQSRSPLTANQRTATPMGALIGSLTMGPVICSLQRRLTMKSGTGLP